MVRTATILLMLTIAVGICPAALVPLLNPGFEVDDNGDGMPDNWRPFTEGEGFTFGLAGNAREGARCARISGAAEHGDRACLGQTTVEVDYPVAYKLSFAVKGKGKATGILRLRFKPLDGPDDDETFHFSIDALLADAWTEQSFQFLVPEEVRAVGKGRIEVLLYQRGEGDLFYDNVAIEPLDSYTPPAPPAAPVAAAPGRQLTLVNRGFEADEDGDGQPDGWRPFMSGEGFEIALADDVFHSGNRSVRLTGLPGHADRSAVNQNTPEVEVSPGYRLSFWMRGTGKPHVVFRFRYTDPDGAPTEETQRVTPTDFSATEWTKQEYEFGAAEGVLKAGKARIEVILYQTGEGTLYYDDVSLEALAHWTGGAEATATTTVSVTPRPVLTNAGFEADENGDGLPDAWNKAIHGDNFELALSDEMSHEGQRSIRITGLPEHGSRACVVQTTPPTKAAPAFRVRFFIRGEGEAAVLLRYHWVNAAGEAGDSAETVVVQGVAANEWSEKSLEFGAPAEVVQAGATRLELILYQRGTGSLFYDDVSIEPLEKWTPQVAASTRALQTPRSPADGREVLQNPPDFTWPPEPGAQSYTVALSPTKDFSAGVITVDGLPYNCLSYSKVLDRQTWYWRYRFTDAHGAQAEWSEPCSFSIAENATEFPVPPPDELLGAIPRAHPRVYATADGLEAFRARRLMGAAAWWESFERRAQAYAEADPPQEPGPEFDFSKRTGSLTGDAVTKMNELRSLGGRACGPLFDLGFAYLVSGDETYGRAAVRWLLELSSWDPEGTTGYRNHDQVFRDIAWQSACVYDWTHDLMTPEQRGLALDAVLARGRILYRDFKEDSRPIYEYPYDSHGWTSMGFLGIIAIALAGDAPEADEWFKFIASTYTPLYPPWGGEEGGWCQGVSYWKYSVYYAETYISALKSATGLDMHQKAFCRNNGWFKLYMHPPWCDRAHFGDENISGPVSSDSRNMLLLASRTGNPYFKWYSEQVFGAEDGGAFGYFWYDFPGESRAPADIVQSHHQADIGWVGMHSDLSDPDDIMLLFKSSPMGSFNHSHADQNHFVIYGYGEPLVIDSGYYDWYGSPHDVNWTRQTKAHNSILVNGEGQPIFDITAKGSITDHFAGPAGGYTVGDATPAYKGKLSKFERHISYVRPDTFLIVDELAAENPSTFTWCCHALEQMQIDEQERRITITQGNAAADIYFAAPGGLRFTQDDEFGTDPQARYASQLKQWHAYVETTEESTTQRFVTLIHVRRAADALQQVEFFSADGGICIKAGEPSSGVLGFVATGEEPVEADGVRCDARQMLVQELPDSSGTLYVGVGLKEYAPARGQAVFGADHAVDAAVWYDAATQQLRDAVIRAAEPTRVSIAYGEQPPTSIGLDGAELAAGAYSYDAKTRLLTLTVAAGEHTITNGAAAMGKAPGITITIDGVAAEARAESIPRYTGGSVALSAFECAEGLYRLALDRPDGTSVSLNGQPLTVSSSLRWLPARNSVEARGTTGRDVRIVLESLGIDEEPRVSAPIEQLPADAVVFEAETFTEFGNGQPSRYSHRTFLSGGVGVGEWTVPGMWMQWQFSVERAGSYNLVIKGSTEAGYADRIIMIDGEPVSGAFLTHRFEHTGGYGATPAEWKQMVVTGADGKPVPITLTAGEHTLYSICVANRLNLDYLALVPMAGQ